MESRLQGASEEEVDIWRDLSLKRLDTDTLDLALPACGRCRLARLAQV